MRKRKHSMLLVEPEVRTGAGIITKEEERIDVRCPQKATGENLAAIH